MGIKEKISEMRPAVRRVFLTISERALIERKNSLVFNMEGLRLKALIREQDKEEIEEYLKLLTEKGHLDSYDIRGDSANVILSKDITLPEMETSQRGLIEENVVRRAVLFRLFEESKKSAYLINAQVTLTKLDECLQVKSSEDIARNVSYLKDIGHPQHRR